MERLRLVLAWTVSGLWVVQAVAAAVPGTGYNPSRMVDVAFGLVMTFLFGGSVLSKWRNEKGAKE